MNYREALAFLYGFSDFERSGRRDGAHFNLARPARLLALLGEPHRRFPSVLVAGTKGKGSTAAMLASILRAAGYCVGLYTQPHLHTYRERIRVDERLISEEEVAALVAQLSPLVAQLSATSPELGEVTTYEIGTALAFAHFAAQQVDLAVLEVGLGGRLDATNVVTPLVSVITSISLDHTDVLGHTLVEIAREKAGIIKERGVVISSPQPTEVLDVLTAVAQERHARLWVVAAEAALPVASGLGAVLRQPPDNRFRIQGSRVDYGELATPLLGAHQWVNATTAIATVEALQEQGVSIPVVAVQEGLKTVRWPGRLEVAHKEPLVVVDGAHNADSAAKLREALRHHFRYDRLILVLGTSSDKDIPGILRELAPAAAEIVVTKSRHPRAASPEVLVREATQYAHRIHISEDVGRALAHALRLAQPADLVGVTGSLFVVAEAREWLGLAGPGDPA